MESGNPLLDDYVLGLTGRGGAARLLPADRERRRRPLPGPLLQRLPRPGAGRRTSASSAASAGSDDVRAHLLSQDVIYVGGGSLISLLGVWRAHGIDEILREAWEAGVVLCGLSAGSLCWFAEALSGYHGEAKRVQGLGLLPHSNAVHYGRGRAPRRLPPATARRRCRTATRPRTAPRFASSATSWSRWSPRGRTPRAYRLEARGGRVVETRSPDAVPRCRAERATWWSLPRRAA